MQLRSRLTHPTGANLRSAFHDRPAALDCLAHSSASTEYEQSRERSRCVPYPEMVHAQRASRALTWTTTVRAAIPLSMTHMALRLSRLAARDGLSALVVCGRIIQRPDSIASEFTQ